MHARPLRAALVTGDRIQITEPGESEDFEADRAGSRALDLFGEREPAGPWSRHGPARTVTGRSRGGCAEVIEETFIAGRFTFTPDVLAGGVLLLETPGRTASRPACREDRPCARRTRHPRRGRRGPGGPPRRSRTSPAVPQQENLPGCALSSATS